MGNFTNEHILYRNSLFLLLKGLVNATNKIPCYAIERFSISVVTKTRVNPITKDSHNPVNQSKLEVISHQSNNQSIICSWCKARENECVGVSHNWFWLYSWMGEKVAGVFKANRAAKQLPSTFLYSYENRCVPCRWNITLNNNPVSQKTSS